MPLETATYIHDFVVTNPAHGDGLNQADSHMRLIKQVLQNQFPNLGDVAVTPTAAQLNQAGGAFSGNVTIAGTLAVTGTTTFTGQASGNGAVPMGSMHTCWPKDPGTTILARGGTATGTELYIEPDGSVYNIVTFPNLGAFLGNTFGGNGTTTFGVPQLNDTGRFLRARTGSVAVGTSQANQTAAHTHAFSFTGGTGSGPTDSQGAHQHNVYLKDPGHGHPGSTTDGGSTGTSGAATNTCTYGNSTTTAQGLTIATNTTGITIGSVNGVANDNLTASAGAHTHTATLSNIAGSGTTGSTGTGSETRPEAFVVVFGIKT